MSDTCRLIYVTTADREEAESIAQGLLEKRLIACANILPGMTSLYWWEGVIRHSGECVLIVKTTAAHVMEVTQAITAAHSYDCPCVVAIPVEGGNAEFLAWIAQQTCETV